MVRRSHLHELATIAAASLVAPLLAATPAFAHPGHSSGLGAGLLHPVTGVDHLLAMLAVGVVTVASVGRRAWLAPAAFLGGMVLGGLAGMAGVPMPGAELLVVASVVVLGLVIAGAVEGQGRLLISGLVLAGLAHGHAHGVEVPTSAHPLGFAAGFLAATAVLHATGAGIGVLVRDRRVVRLGLGTAMVATGALLVL